MVYTLFSPKITSHFVVVILERFYDRPVGIQNGRIKNSAMTASSQWDANHAAWLARLHRPRRGRFMGAWSSRHKNHNQWLQIDMGRSMKVTGIATQGRQDADQWVTAYYIYVSSDGVNFAKVKHWWNYVKVEYYTQFYVQITSKLTAIGRDPLP